MRIVYRTLAAAMLVGLAACHTPNVDAVEENAIVAEGDTRDAADWRAANLDRLADDLDARAQGAGNAATALRNEAAEDRAEADAVRAAGDAAADEIEGAAENAVGTGRR